jgi:hypothetical protein
MGTNNEREVVPAMQGEFAGASFSPYGSKIYYSLKIHLPGFHDPQRICSTQNCYDTRTLSVITDLAFAAVAVSPDGTSLYGQQPLRW